MNLLAGSLIRAAIPLRPKLLRIKNMQINKLSSATMAAAAAMLFTAGISTASYAADAATVHCTGVNSCKGTSECKSAKNSCKGMNSCKGQGFVSMTKEACADAKSKAAAAK
jgi:hypothetical protein